MDWLALAGFVLKTGQALLPEFLAALNDGRIDGNEWKKIIGSFFPSLGNTNPQKPSIVVNLTISDRHIAALMDILTKLATKNTNMENNEDVNRP
jgi:hypothetical protein